jgi:hypothetical protein
MQETGTIRHSRSPARSPQLFVPKAHGRRLRLCIDYKELNKIIIANLYPLPIMSELQDEVSGTRIWMKMNLKNGYYLIHVKNDNEWKNFFRDRNGLYEFMVIPVSLTNAPATFQYMMNHILKDLFDEGVVVYIGDVLIFT